MKSSKYLFTTGPRRVSCRRSVAGENVEGFLRLDFESVNLPELAWRQQLTNCLGVFEKPIYRGPKQLGRIFWDLLKRSRFF